MARIRTIKPEFWTSEQVVECSPVARLLFIGIWNFADDSGVHPFNYKRLKMEIFPADEIDVRPLVAELLKAGLLREFQAGGEKYLVVTGWQHQKIEKPNYKYPFPTLMDGQPEPPKESVADQSPTNRRLLDYPETPERNGKEWKGNDSYDSSVSSPPFGEQNQFVSEVYEACRTLSLRRTRKAVAFMARTLQTVRGVLTDAAWRTCMEEASAAERDKGAYLRRILQRRFREHGRDFERLFHVNRVSDAVIDEVLHGNIGGADGDG